MKLTERLIHLFPGKYILQGGLVALSANMVVATLFKSEVITALDDLQWQRHAFVKTMKVNRHLHQLQLQHHVIISSYVVNDKPLGGGIGIS